MISTGVLWALFPRQETSPKAAETEAAAEIPHRGQSCRGKLRSEVEQLSPPVPKSQLSACLETVVLSHMYKPLLSTAMYLCFILTGCQQLSLTNTTVSKQALGGLEVLVNAFSSTPISTILQVPVSPGGLRRGTAYNCGGAVLRQAGSPAKSNRDVTGNTSGSSQGHSSGGRSLWHRPGYEEWPPCVLQVNHTQTWLLLSSVHSCLNPLGRDGSA